MKNEFHKKHSQCNKIADDVMKNGMLIGCHQGMKKSDLEYIFATLLKNLFNNENHKNEI